MDPLAAKYHGWSPYNYCINNPLIVIDPNGKELYVGGEDPESSLYDIQNFAGADSKRITVDSDGKISINRNGYKKGANKNLDVLILLVDAKNDKGVNLKFGYATPNVSMITDVNGQPYDPSPVANYSTTPMFEGFKSQAEAINSKFPGFDALVEINSNVTASLDGQDIERNQIIGHELEESYNRTALKQNYNDAHANANKDYFGGTDSQRVKLGVKIK